MAMESTPDSGVEIRNAAVAPRLAPCFLKLAAAGKTEQEQSGKGIPSKAALKTDRILPRLRCLAMVSGERKRYMSPATRTPRNKYGAASTKRCQLVWDICTKTFMIHSHTNIVLIAGRVVSASTETSRLCRHFLSSVGSTPLRYKRSDPTILAPPHSTVLVNPEDALE